MQKTQLKASARRLFAAMIILAAPLWSYADDWPQLQHDAAHSGFSSDAAGPPAGTYYIAKWRWHPDKVTSVPGRVQPVVSGGVLCIGFYDGKMYALDANTGALKWSYQTGGSILHAAAMDATNVYFGSHDGYLYAVGIANGALAWRYNTGHPIDTAPCLANGAIYIGNTAGIMYAISTAGSLQWTYNSGRPILTSAAYANGTVYGGNEGMYAFALSAASGAQKWKVRLKGQSLAVYWPVVMDSQGVVFYRTEPVNVFHEILGEGDNVLGGDTDPSGNYGDGTPTQIATEQANIRGYLTSNKDAQTFWALDITNGAEKYVAPILYTSGEGSVPVPPVFDPATNRAWVMGRSRYARWDSGQMVRRFGAEPMALDPATGNYTLLSSSMTNGSGIHVIGDETSILSADSYGLLVGAFILGYIRHVNATAQHVISHATGGVIAGDADSGPPYVYDSNAGWPLYSVAAGGGSGGGQCNAAVVANNSIYWIGDYGLLIRVDKQ